MKRRYTLIYWREGRWYVGRLKERPDVFSQGESLSELEENIKDALMMMEEIEAGEIPEGYQTKEIIIGA